MARSDGGSLDHAHAVQGEGEVGGVAVHDPQHALGDVRPQMTAVDGDGLPGPENVAGVVAMLVSDDGAFITGTEIRIDGGAHM
ncbi:SDR family oxidoreductase [Nonomuraea angiospora]|uniref:SDR family oxidoreductase n=1 Tax=Nonomuraea angiospora TaxID=46172 RepID=UPI0029AD9E20|nr:SDR family oxidoreductase [Nonomuraea angiospora]MDX3110978.1 SDR family oxidoreductase [Nonomuraea angiospora]